MAVVVFLGVFIGVLPTLGVALPLTALAATLLRVPKAPALVASFIATPPTLFLFFYPLGYLVGLQAIDPPPIGIDLLPALREITFLNAGQHVAILWEDARWHILAFCFGMLIMATVTAVLSALVTLVVMGRRNQQRALARQARRVAPDVRSSSG